MGDTEDSLQPSKKRAAGREISRDNPGLDDDEEGTSEQEMGTFKRASDDVLSRRKIVKVRRNQASSTPSAPSSNPFAGVRLVPPPGSAATPAVVPDEAQGGENQSENEANVDANKETDQETDEKDKESERKVDELKDEATADKCKNDGEEDKPESTVDKEKNEGKLVKPESTVDKEKNEGKLVKPEFTDEKDKNDGEVDKPESTDEKDKNDSAMDKHESTDDKDVDGEKSQSKPEEPDNADKNDIEGQKAEDEVKKDDGNENVEKWGEAASFSSFQQLSSSQNAFTGLAGTGFSGSTFSFGSVTKEGSSLGSGSIFGPKNDQPSFSFGLSNNGSSLFGTSGTSATTTTKSEGSGLPPMQEVPVETGEENERPVFVADSVLFEYLDGAWKERGKGEVKVNISTTGTGKARLVMRTRGNYRLILNASLFSDMKLTNMDKRGVTFACVNSIGDGKDGLSTFALKFKEASKVGEFQACVTEHKDKTSVALKTPENSPKATDD